MYKNRFQQDAARSAPRNVSTNISPAPRMLPTRAMQMHKIAVLRSPPRRDNAPGEACKAAAGHERALRSAAYSLRLGKGRALLHDGEFNVLGRDLVALL